MDFEVKHYVEEYWIEEHLEGSIYEIKSREDYVKSFIPDKWFLAFRFYDREVINYDNKKYVGEPINYTDFISANDEKYDEIIESHAFLRPEEKFKSVNISPLVKFDDYKKELIGEAKVLK